MQRPGPTLLVRLRETGSANNMQLVLHKRLAGVCRSHFSQVIETVISGPCGGDPHGGHAYDRSLELGFGSSELLFNSPRASNNYLEVFC